MSDSRSKPKIKRTFIKDEVYNELQKQIVTGELQPGTKLRDQELSVILGISRTPIREALLKLENDGLVVTKANRWTLVSPIDLGEAESIYPIVWTLENLAIEQAFHRICLEDIDKLEQYNELLKKFIKTGDKFTKIQTDNAFHDIIVGLSDNPELPKLLAGLKMRIQRVEMHYFNDDNRMQASYEEHREIIRLIKKQDLLLTQDALKNNWNNSLEYIRTSINQTQI